MYIVKQQSRRTWGIYNVLTGRLVEGGFFHRYYADAACRQWQNGTR